MPQQVLGGGLRRPPQRRPVVVVVVVVPAEQGVHEPRRLQQLLRPRRRRRRRRLRGLRLLRRHLPGPLIARCGGGGGFGRHLAGCSAGRGARMLSSARALGKGAAAAAICWTNGLPADAPARPWHGCGPVSEGCLCQPAPYSLILPVCGRRKRGEGSLRSAAPCGVLGARRHVQAPCCRDKDRHLCSLACARTAFSGCAVWQIKPVTSVISFHHMQTPCSSVTNM